jgi:hypothetical protein
MKIDNRGQVLLITLLILAVGLTAGLAIVSRSVTDIRISQQEEESARALSLAEAGIEKALIDPTILSGGDVVSGVNYTVTQEILGNDTEFDFGEGRFAAGDTQTVWLVGHSGEDINRSDPYLGSQIEVFWGNKGTPRNLATTPALEATFIYYDGVYKIARYALDPNSVGRPSQNSFNSSINNPSVALGEFSKILTVPVTTYALRLKLLYNNIPHNLGIRAVGSVTIPEQGSCYTSTATVQNSGITRSVKQCNFFKAPPEIFDYVLFSGGDLVK